jgi:murein DD-endopeptidase MepM/ murein hydrolase activator NlpD
MAVRHRSALAVSLLPVLFVGGLAAAAGAASATASTTTTTAAPRTSHTSAPATPTTSTTVPCPTVAATSTTTSSTTSTTTVPCPVTTTTTTAPATTVAGTTPATLPPGASTVVPANAEIPPDEEELLGLIDDVHSRLSELQADLTSLNTQLAANQVAYNQDSATLVGRQAAVYNTDRKVDAIEVDEASARMAMRIRAIAAYIHQPSNDLATMLLHLQDPAELVDARAFYQDLVDAQVQAIKSFDALGKAAKRAAKSATAARDLVLHQQQTVATESQDLETLKQTLTAVEQESNDQQSEQTKLLAQVGLDRAEFAAEVAAEAEEDVNIEQLLASLDTPGGETAPATGAFFAFPIPGAPITSPYGPRIDPIAGYLGFHPGVDFGAPMGTPIHAAGAGIVVFAGQESGYGNYTCISHGHGIATCYGHQSAILVNVGQTVTQGQVIGLVGSTGYSTGPHLHFEVRINGQVTDPMPWLTGVPPEAPTTTTTTTTTSTTTP